MRTCNAASTTRGLLWFAWMLLAPHFAAAQELPCRHDLDCPDSMNCESYTYTVCSGLNDEECHEETPNRCFPTFIRPCESDADCGPYFVCGTQTRPICGDIGGTGGSGAAALVITGSGGAPEKCHEFTQHICMLTHTPCTQASDCAVGFDCALDPYCPPFHQPPSNTGTGGSFAAGGSGGAYEPYEPFDAGPPRDCTRICAPPFDPFFPPYTGSGGASGGIDEDGGPGASGSGGSGSASGTGGWDPLGFCGGVLGSGGVWGGSGGVWGGSGGSGSLASGTGGSGASSDSSSDSHHDGADHLGHVNGFGCAVSDGGASASWFALVGSLGMGLRLRARRRDR
jgi:hypothetical protein